MIERYGTILLFLIVVLLSANGCARQENGESRPARYHPLKGQVVALEPASSLITIAHEKIPDFMEAMTMPFSVKDSALFRGVEVGDSVRGVVAVRKPEIWLDSLTVIWKMPPSK
ncbi:MAG: copper-binding protein [Ignavibacteriales bacterium]|nr:copper-binding protein [Ignavibacteriales bacterium]